MTSKRVLTGVFIPFVLATLAACGGGGSGGGGSGTPLAGSLDTSFNTDGIVSTPFGIRLVANAIALQSDGKIVAAGYHYNGANDDIALARYNADGSLDTTFDGDGIVTTAAGSSVAKAIALQSDGKIVVAGYSFNVANTDIALVRYNANGSLDTTFGTGGIVTTPVGTSADVANAIALQSDGKIVVAGYSLNGASYYTIALARYNANGSLDTSFDGDGIVTTAVGTGNNVANAIALQSDGKIVVAGYSFSGTSDDIALARYNANGSLDTSFDGDGIVTTPVGGSNDGANAIALQSDGKIVVAGYSYSGANLDTALARYNANGSLDTSFDGDGIVTTAVGTGNDIANAIALQSDGMIVVAGYGSDVGVSGDNIALARYNANGSLDTTFDGDGIVTTTVGIGNIDDVAKAIALQSDGKIVVAGSSDNGSSVLARYHP